jgi:Zn finger protein HypA/HybF involved in hydrogenase expression
MRCYVCDTFIDDNEDYVICNNCGNEFHKECLDNFINCPVCYTSGHMKMITDN